MTDGMSAGLMSELRQLQRDMHDGRRLESMKIKAMNEGLAEDAEYVAAKMGVRKPDITRVIEADVNAFAGRVGNSKTRVSFTWDAAQLLDKDSLRIVLAHEMSHIHHNDQRSMIRLQKAAVMISDFAAGGMFAFGNLVEPASNMKTVPEAVVFEGVLIAASVGASRIARMALTPIISVMNRKREMRADKEAIRALGAMSEIRFRVGFVQGGMHALDTLLDGRRPKERPESRVRLVASKLKEVNNNLYMFAHRTHPSTLKRLRYAINYAKKYGIGD